MVYHNTLPELHNAYQGMVGIFDYADPVHRPDGQRALQLASLQPGQSVLDLGAGSGRLIAAAKQAVGAGFCLAVDGVTGFLNIDIPWQLHRVGLTVHPQGSPQQQVHLLRANITDGALRNTILALPGAPPTFDCIFAIHVLNTVPAHQRLQLLRTLRRLLKPDGRLILTMSARFTDVAPLPAEANLPVQFRSTRHTEAPGAVLVAQTVATPLVEVPQGHPRPLKKVELALQLSPDRFWTLAAQQARDAASRAGFNVESSLPIGKGDSFGLPVLGHSPSQAQLAAMSLAQVATHIDNMSLAHGYVCVGRANVDLLRRVIPGWAALAAAAQDLAVVMALQTRTEQFRQTVSGRNTSLPSGQLVGQQYPEHQQVGVMVVLR